ncbi:UpxY family transcription antiterminator [Panacibacter ginsenosidivorans]|uniref:UpxY family transcription antiterminator n=1 Tax=Panacibacter ginsenosidivorans TaxID=1813871 RepID=A0A5B8VCN2_9BACT|nr:UpxY family transcription antiterminator [Panacibacter ginsenosidivorans]QEC69062.1 UpxY family transcription antiterminator [Panacibacter ginsenosidivorans]
MNASEKKWFAVYTKPRWEKKVNSILLLKGVASWCPVQKTERQWSDRKKIIEDPLFKSYVFVKINDDEKLTVLQTEGILNFVHFLGKPAVIKDEEIETIKSFLLEKDAKINIQSLQGFKEDDKVVIKHGIFMDNTGTVIRTAAKKIYVRLESLDQVMIVEFPANYAGHYFPLH